MAGMQITQEQLSAAIAGDLRGDRRTAGPTETVVPSKDLLQTVDLLRTKGDLIAAQARRSDHCKYIRYDLDNCQESDIPSGWHDYKRGTNTI
jgi:hypothetical protein